ncbi:amidase [Brevibacillus sp. 179-C 1.1 NHS]|uniref:amidase n=1 Tax=Brevibacillus sp. 179-C 1.1 NHS TaxID=3235177 RepID=UPI0039A269BE
MNELTYLTATEMGTWIRERKISAEEATRQAFQRITSLNPELNAIVAHDEKAAMEAAKLADKEIQEGIYRGPLHGVPITIKDSFSTTGLATTSGFTRLKGYIPPRDAAVVNRLKQAGAVLLGKTNVPPLLMDMQTDNDIYGRTNNPWDLARTPGGSSGGSAAAVAAGLSYLDIGSDIGGSLRVPAHYCGVFSLKPTEGAVPATGHMPGFEGTADYASSRHLACYGPVARSIEDLAAAFSIISGSNSNSGLPHGPQPLPPSSMEQPLHIRWMEELPGYPTSRAIREQLRQFVKKLEQRGMRVEQVTAPPLDVRKAWETWGKIIDAELNSTTPALIRGLTHLMTLRLSREIPSASMLVPLTFKNYMRVLTIREQLIRSFEQFMTDCDLFLCPVSCTTAFPHMAKTKMVGYQPIYKQPLFVDETPQNYWIATTFYTSLFNVTGSPVVTMPIGFDEQGLPIGIQCVGKRWRDRDLLKGASTLYSICPEWLAPAFS